MLLVSDGLQKPKYLVNFEDGYGSTVGASDIVDISNTAVERAAARPQKPVLGAAIAGIGEVEAAATVPASSIASTAMGMVASSSSAIPTAANAHADSAALASAANADTDAADSSDDMAWTTTTDLTSAVGATLDSTGWATTVDADSATAVETAAISAAADDAVAPYSGGVTGTVPAAAAAVGAAAVTAATGAKRVQSTW